jgi:hypothetical protein
LWVDCGLIVERRRKGRKKRKKKKRKQKGKGKDNRNFLKRNHKSENIPSIINIT